MNKHQYLANFNTEIWQPYAELVGKGNIRQDLEQYMKQKVQMAARNTKGIDIAQLNLEIEQLENQFEKLHTKLMTKKETKEKIEQGIKEAEKARLAKEKEIIEQALCCINCGNLLKTDQKSHKFSKGTVCHACFMASDRDMVKIWGMDED